MKKNVAVIGVGAVGVEILRILKQRKFPVGDLRVFARSSRTITVDRQDYQVEAMEGADFSGIDIALFAGTEGEKGASVLYAQKFIAAGAVVIDNGNDFRLEKDVPLVVPEVNKQKALENKGIIANPNCTTIQMVVALGGIYKKFGLSQIILTSLQAVSGAGRGAIQTLWDETKEIAANNQSVDSCFQVDKRIKNLGDSFPAQIAFNAIPQIGGFSDDGYTSEEWKVVHETRKIYADDSIKISATCVRVPVFNSHSETVYFTTKNKASLDQIKDVLKVSEGVEFLDPARKLPLALEADGKDPVYVGRLRPDPYQENSFWLWCVSDNLRKGAALNAVQIAELLLKK
ncbi:MAG: aspartate-semialdehyde dehydrogenase [Candidatus Omnitrophica bacterium]|nr:aspartate-semialdehyde dehydrogenase [Candidatus Omnitrophota bacterium]MBU2251561.1 aspartate-semialdehyde dehydrogenase [Candidatus Omnitrophota bacterium]MBU2473977.1 aspartate-semialdehyde dehydrogenase [Candidatus Omnitrophota bacterium]